MLLHGGGVATVAVVLADVLEGPVVVLDSEGHRLAGESAARPLDSTALEAAVAEARASGRSVEVASADGPSYVAVALAGTEHLGTLLLHGVRDGLGTADRRTLERGALVTALVLLFARTVAEAEERVRGELLSDLLERRDLDRDRLRERARRQQADLDGPTAVAVAAVEGIERHRAAQVAARLAGELRGPGRRARRPGGAGRAGRGPARGRPAAARAGACGRRPLHGRGGGRRRRAGGRRRRRTREARRCLDTLLTLGRAGEVSDPAGLGLARLLLGQNGPEELDEFIEAMVGPVLAYDVRRGTELVATLEAWFAAGGRARRRPRSGCTCTRTPSPSGSTGSARCSATDWRDPARGLDVQLALRLYRLRPADPAARSADSSTSDCRVRVWRSTCQVSACPPLASSA